MNYSQILVRYHWYIIDNQAAYMTPLSSLIQFLSSLIRWWVTVVLFSTGKENAKRKIFRNIQRTVTQVFVWIYLAIVL